MKRKLHYLVLAFFLIILTNSTKAQPGNALNFDGSNDGVSIPSVAGFGVSKVSIETWVYWTPNAATDVQFICSKGLGAGTEVLEIHTGGTANSLRFLPRPNVYIDITNALPVNRWTHIAYVHDPSTSYLKIYINGVEKSYTVTLGSISTALTTNGNAFSIGKRSSNEYYFKGSIDEFRFWNVVRTQAEIQANMYNSISPSSTGLFAYYNFDASSGTSLADQTTNNNTGTLGGPFAFTGTISNWTESYAMVVPTATAATNAYTTSLTANWTAPIVGTVTNYLLDVSTSSTFASFVSGYSGLSVSGTTKIVTGLTASTTYYYRVRADKTSVTGQGSYSNVITTATTTTPLPPGNALNFDGSNDGVSIPSVVGFGVSKATIETWVYWTPTANTDVQFICSKGLGAGTEVLEIHTGITANGLRFLPRPNVYIDVTNALPVNRWTHIAYVHDPSTSYLKIYINGVEKSYTVTLGSISTALTTSSNAFSIGKRSSNEYYFKGSVDEFRFWNVVRTQAEIQTNMFNTISPSSTGLFAYYNFDHGTAGGTNTGITTLVDQTSNANNGTLNGPFALTGATSNWIASTAWNTWTGTTSNAFATATNWQLVAVPTTVDNIVIPTGASNLPVMITGTEAVNMLSIQASASATVTGTLKIAGPIYNSGTLTATSGTIELNGTAAQTIAASTFAGNIIQNLIINNTAGVTLGGALNIIGTLMPTLGALNTGGFLTLKSDAVITARIAAGTGSYISGNVTVERYIPAGKRGFRFLTSPVTTTNFIKGNWQEGANNTSLLYASNQNPVFGYGTHITGSATGANGFDATGTGSASLFQFNNVTQLWNTGITNTNATNLIAGNAYRLLVRGDRAFDLTTTSATNTATTLRATGTLLSGSVTFSSAGSTPSSLPILAAGVSEFSFIGNPYASPIDWNALTKTGLTGYYYIWDPTIGTRGAYVSCFTDGTKSNGSSAVTTAIQSGQAFFVQNTLGVSARQLDIAEANKTTGNTNVFRTTTGTSTLGIQLFLSTNINTASQDGTNILFNSSYSNAVNDDDAGKFTNQDENIAVQRGNSLMSIERRNLPVSPSDTVKLKAWQLTQNNYTLRIASSNFDAGLAAYLQDSYLNIETALNLAGTTDISFTTTAIAASTATDRFRIVFRASGALPVTITNLKAYQKNRGVQVEWNTVNELNMDAYEVEKSVDGAAFSKAGTVAATGSSSYNWFDVNPINGNNYYRIKLLDKNGSFKYTQVINVKMGSIKSVFTIVENPIKNKTVVLQLENVEKGNYSAIIYNNLGQQIITKTIVHAGGSGSETLELGHVAKGSYQLSIIGNKVKETKTIIVE